MRFIPALFITSPQRSALYACRSATRYHAFQICRGQVGSLPDKRVADAVTAAVFAGAVRAAKVLPTKRTYRACLLLSACGGKADRGRADVHVAITSDHDGDDDAHAKPTLRSRRRRWSRRGRPVAGREGRTLSGAYDHARRTILSRRIDRHTGTHSVRAFAAIAETVRHCRKSNRRVRKHWNGRCGSIGTRWLHIPI